MRHVSLGPSRRLAWRGPRRPRCRGGRLRRERAQTPTRLVRLPERLPFVPAATATAWRSEAGPTEVARIEPQRPSRGQARGGLRRSSASTCGSECSGSRGAICTLYLRTRAPLSDSEMSVWRRAPRKTDMLARSIAATLLACLAFAATASAAPRGLDVGFFDYAFSSSAFHDPTPEERAAWLDEARASGAGIVRVHVRWAEVAAVRPGHGADPNDSAYRWTSVDSAVQGATARGLKVLLSIHDAPRWAEGPRRPRRAAAGSWLPNVRALSEFAEASARRYPGVTRWQVWNEPNLDLYLGPQWTRRKGGFAPTAANHYRRMLNAAYSAIKRVNRKNLVVVAGTAPYGDPPGRTRCAP